MEKRMKNTLNVYIDTNTRLFLKRTLSRIHTCVTVVYLWVTDVRGKSALHRTSAY